jgi:hypothetical protein
MASSDRPWRGDAGHGVGGARQAESLLAHLYI